VLSNIKRIKIGSSKVEEKVEPSEGPKRQAKRLKL